MSTNVTKFDLVASAAEQAGTTKASTELIINAIFETIEAALVSKRSVTLVGFGTFAVGTRQARKGRNPQTKKEIDIPSATVAKFRPGKLLKEAVNR